MNNKYYMVDDGWFTYFVNMETGEKKLTLDPGDEVIRKPLDLDQYVVDFS